jgi:cytochrome c oxidase assembly protein subunit 15
MTDSILKSSSSLRAALITWYLAGCFLVFGMVVVGGITRLTGSGLSITEWKVITGTIPPLNEQDWITEFEKYQQIPQYKEINRHFTLEDFKFIYFWEYIHRLFGRLIGLVFLVGFIYFAAKRVLHGKLLWLTLGMFALGGIQGFLGWYMVSSGLTQNVSVSHIRLAIHLTFAFLTFGYIFYVALTQLYPEKTTHQFNPLKKVSSDLLIMVTLQVIYGGFVAGLKAGHVYNTWPTMDGAWFPESINYAWNKNGASSLWNNPATVQFIHRIIAYLITLMTISLIIKTFKTTDATKELKNASVYLGGLILLQVILGITTLLTGVPIWLGVLHQAIAFFVFAGVIYYRRRTIA